MPYSSNVTLLVTVSLGGDSTSAIYKPFQGERPLWDFPDGLYRREVAAWILSEALGWELIPPTVIRTDGPYGIGSLQLFIDADFEQHYFPLSQRSELKDVFVKFATFDLIANNADRKSGHVLIGRDGHLWGIDNGLTFHVEPKLRTVIWEFGGTKFSGAEADDINRVIAQAPEIFRELIAQDEIDALIRRARYVLSKKSLPDIEPDMRPYPWPLV